MKPFMREEHPGSGKYEVRIRSSLHWQLCRKPETYLRTLRLYDQCKEWNKLFLTVLEGMQPTNCECKDKCINNFFYKLFL